MRRIITDFLVLVPLTRCFFIPLGERDKHQIRDNPYYPCHPCAIVKTRAQLRQIRSNI